MPTSIDTPILYWLISLGYKLYGQDEADIHAMFEREAAQWGLSVQQLATWIREDFARQGVAPLAPASGTPASGTPASGTPAPGTPVAGTPVVAPGAAGRPVAPERPAASGASPFLARVA